MKRLFKLKYPKIFLLVASVLVAYFLFQNPVVSSFFSNLGNLSYLGLFIAGMLFAFGFSAPFAVGFFITLNPSNIYLATIIAALGAMTSNLIIFNFIRFSFEEEFAEIRKTKTFKEINYVIDKNFHGKIKSYLMYIFAGIIIASPLPDEAGVIMLAGLSEIKQHTLAILTFILSTIGIFVILNI